MYYVSDCMRTQVYTVKTGATLVEAMRIMGSHMVGTVPIIDDESHVVGVLVLDDLLTQSDFLTSAFPAEYGNGVSGVFDLHLRNGNNRKREYVAEIGLMGLEIGAEGPFTKNGRACVLCHFFI